jgi:Mn2+/Fe2+ NRAMP family transporter
MLVAHDRGIMGQTANGRWLNGLGWGTTIAMFTAAISLILIWCHS